MVERVERVERADGAERGNGAERVGAYPPWPAAGKPDGTEPRVGIGA
jgi:hypothetical protein